LIYAFAKLALTNFFDLSNIRSVSWETTVILGNSRCGYAIFAQMILNEGVARTTRSTSDSSGTLPVAERLHTRLGKILFANAQVGFFAVG
jgi:hypothetical protein